MEPKLRKIEEEFIEAIGQLSVSLSINRIVGQLYALLFLSSRPLSLDDMVDRLKISKGNASVNIRELERWGAVREVWIKGERKNFYEANLDVLKIVASCVKNGLIERLEKVMQRVEKTEIMIESCQSEPVNSDEKNKLKIYNERLKMIRNLAEKAEDLLKILSTAV